MTSRCRRTHHLLHESGKRGKPAIKGQRHNNTRLVIATSLVLSMTYIRGDWIRTNGLLLPKQAL